MIMFAGGLRLFMKCFEFSLYSFIFGYDETINLEWDQYACLLSVTIAFIILMNTQRRKKIGSKFSFSFPIVFRYINRIAW